MAEQGQMLQSFKNLQRNLSDFVENRRANTSRKDEGAQFGSTVSVRDLVPVPADRLFLRGLLSARGPKKNHVNQLFGIAVETQLRIDFENTMLVISKDARIELNEHTLSLFGLKGAEVLDQDVEMQEVFPQNLLVSLF